MIVIAVWILAGLSLLVWSEVRYARHMAASRAFRGEGTGREQAERVVPPDFPDRENFVRGVASTIQAYQDGYDEETARLEGRRR